MTFNEYVKDRKGKAIDFDKSYGYQCVDLIDDYIVNFLKLKLGFWGNARQWGEDFNKSTFLQNNFLLIDAKHARIGDILISYNGKYGHVAIATSKQNKNGYINIIEQNNPEKYVVERMRKLTTFSAVLRPRNNKELIALNEVKKYGNATVIKNKVQVYSSNTSTNPVGSLFRNDRVKVLGTALNKPIVAYKVTGGYKVGILKDGKEVLKND